MIWLVLRRQRTAQWAAFVLVVLVAGILIGGRFVELHRADSAGVRMCLARGGLDACQDTAWNGYLSQFWLFWGPTRSLLLLIPAVVGAIAGAGLFGREFESGTYVFALTQSVSRAHWWAAGLLIAGIPTVLLVGLLSLTTTWAFDPFAKTIPVQALTPPIFDTSGLVPIAYAAEAFTLAAIAGIALKSTPGAAGLALVLNLATQASLGLFGRRLYAVPQQATSPIAEADGYLQTAAIPDGSWLLSSGFLDSHGNRVPPALISSCTTVDCLTSFGATQSYSEYHPIANYWRFQLIESGIFLLICGIALIVGYIALARRVR